MQDDMVFTIIYRWILGIVCFFRHSEQAVISIYDQQHLVKIIILVMSFKMPSGVLLYWFISTLVSTLQQLSVNREGTPAKPEIIAKAK